MRSIFHVVDFATMQSRGEQGDTSAPASSLHAAGLPDPVLLRTKLHPPPVRVGLVPRARLDALLEAGAQARLCLLDAPAGSGKTTLLAQWCLANQGSRRVGWVSLDEGDDDPVRFWVHVLEAFRSVEPGLGEMPLKLLVQSTS